MKKNESHIMFKNKYLTILLLSVFLFSCGQRGNNQQTVTAVDYNLLVAARIQELTEENNLSTLQNQKVFWGNDTVNTYMLSDFAAQQILFFYFSNNTCPPCIEQSVKTISNHIPDYTTNSKVIFISPDCMPRFRENQYGKRVLGLVNEKLGLKLEEEYVPFFFTLNKDMEINDLHVVNKNDFSRTSEYLRKLTPKLQL